MIMTNKILAIALVAALVGGGLGAIAMHSSDSSQAATTTASDTTSPSEYATNVKLNTVADRQAPEFKTAEEQTAYKVGFADGFQAATQNRGRAGTYQTAYGSSARQSRVYNNHSQPRGRSFWQKHRDKLTMGIGTGGGALIGGLIGGKKGAGIGALAGLGGSALYTYKLRKRSHR